MRAALGLAPHEPLPPNARELYEKARIEQGLPGGPLADATDDEGDDFDDESGPSDASNEMAVTSDDRAEGESEARDGLEGEFADRGGNDRGDNRKSNVEILEAPEPMTPEPAAPATAGAPSETSEPEDDAPKPKRKAAPRRKPKKPATKDSEGEVPAAESEEAPAPKPKRAKKAAPARKSTRRTPPAKSAGGSATVAETVLPTGSSDKHLINDDVPVDPEPVSRPRSYRDLDAIPDDFD
jgi:outer membrane biosynthesis protein TonB